MENKQQKKTKRVYTPEQKADAVRIWKESGESIAAVAKRLGMTDTTLGKWIAQDSIDRGERDGTTTADRKEIERLKKELKQAQMERDFLKKAAVFFAKDGETK